MARFRRQLSLTTYSPKRSTASRPTPATTQPSISSIRIEENARFHIDSLNTDAFATGKALFRQHEPLSFVDACIIAYMQTEGLGYLYAFDDDFDAAEDVYRLDTATNPYDPN